MAMYTAYFDESTGNGSPIFVVAGFLSPDVHWMNFEKEWSAVLGEFGITAFHAQHFSKHKEEFRGWDEPKRQRLMAMLLEIIQRRAHLGFAASVNVADFKEVFKGRDRAEIGSIYKLCCTACFTEVGVWAEKNNQVEPIAHFFDDGNNHAEEVLRTYREIKKNPKKIASRLGPIAFESDSELVPLQAADLAAYELWKWLDEHFANKARHGRFPLQEIVKIPWRIRAFDKPILQEMLDRRHGKQVQPRTIHTFISALRPGKVDPQ